MKVISQFLKLTEIERSGRYFDENGFVYSPNNSKRSKNLYFRCKYSNQYKCLARVIVRDQKFNSAYLTRNHGHLPHKVDLCRSKFSSRIKSILKEEKFLTTREAYCKVRESVLESNVEYEPEEQSFASLVHRFKKKFQPKIPKSFEEFHEYICNENYREQYSFDNRNQAWYRGIWRSDEADSMIVFISETGLRFLDKQKYIEFAMDGTFEIVPRHIKFSQLYIMSFIYDNRSYPFTFVLMQRRDSASYNIIFSKLKLLLHVDITNKVVKCMADYEKSIRKSLRQHFPIARITGCWFHYTRAINKAANRFKLLEDSKFEQAIKEVCHVALLPNNFISEGFDYIDTKIKNSKRWLLFSSYWRRQWLNANISVYGLRHRTDNFSEALNRSINLLSGRPHQNIWSVLRTIKKINTIKTDELMRHSKGKIFKNKKNNFTIELNKKILDASLRFEENQDIGRFLKNVSYRCEKNVSIKSEYTTDEGFVDDYITNDYDDSCNLPRRTSENQCTQIFE